MDATIYKILVYSLPLLLSVLAFIGGLAVKSLVKLANDVNDIKVTIGKISERHDSLEKRVDKLEESIL